MEEYNEKSMYLLFMMMNLQQYIKLTENQKSKAIKEKEKKNHLQQLYFIENL